MEPQSNQDQTTTNENSNSVNNNAGQGMDTPEIKTTASSGNGFSVTRLAIAALAAVVLFGALYWFFFMNDSVNNAEQPQFSLSTDEMEDRNYPDVVATVNGEAITKEEFEEAIARSAAVAAQQGFDVNDPSVYAQIEGQALSVLTNRVLLIEAATNAGITVDEAAVDNRIAVLETQFGSSEALMEQAESLGLDMEELRQDVSEQLLVDQYIRSHDAFASIEVSDEQVASAYDSLTESIEDAPPLAEIEENIRTQIQAQAEQEITGQIIEGLLSEAEIESNL